MRSPATGMPRPTWPDRPPAESAPDIPSAHGTSLDIAYRHGATACGSLVSMLRSMVDPEQVPVPRVERYEQPLDQLVAGALEDFTSSGIGELPGTAGQVRP